MTPPPLVQVTWLDARSVYEQMPLRDARTRIKLSPRVTVGFLVERTRERILLAGTYDPPDDFEEEGGVDFTAIASGWIKNVRRLKGATARPKSKKRSR